MYYHKGNIGGQLIGNVNLLIKVSRIIIKRMQNTNATVVGPIIIAIELHFILNELKVKLIIFYFV